MAKRIEVSFVLDKDDMTDEQYESQDEIIGHISEDELKKLIAEKYGFKSNEICDNSFTFQIVIK